MMPRLSRSQWLALRLIGEMVETRGADCFTYDTLIRFWSGTRKPGIRANTLERRLRELAAYGLVERRQKPGSRGFYYCLTVKGRQLLKIY